MHIDNCKVKYKTDSQSDCVGTSIMLIVPRCTIILTNNNSCNWTFSIVKNAVMNKQLHFNWRKHFRWNWFTKEAFSSLWSLMIDLYLQFIFCYRFSSTTTTILSRIAITEKNTFSFFNWLISKVPRSPFHWTLMFHIRTYLSKAKDGNCFWTKGILVLARVAKALNICQQ